MAAGGVVTAAGIWMPGEKTISIPSGKVFTYEREFGDLVGSYDGGATHFKMKRSKFSEAELEAALRSCYEDGSTPSMIVVDTHVAKRLNGHVLSVEHKGHWLDVAAS